MKTKLATLLLPLLLGNLAVTATGQTVYEDGYGYAKPRPAHHYFSGSYLHRVQTGHVGWGATPGCEGKPICSLHDRATYQKCPCEIACGSTMPSTVMDHVDAMFRGLFRSKTDCGAGCREGSCGGKSDNSCGKCAAAHGGQPVRSIFACRGCGAPACQGIAGMGYRQPCCGYAVEYPLPAHDVPAPSYSNPAPAQPTRTQPATPRYSIPSPSAPQAGQDQAAGPALFPAATSQSRPRYVPTYGPNGVWSRPSMPPGAPARTAAHGTSRQVPASRDRQFQAQVQPQVQPAPAPRRKMWLPSQARWVFPEEQQYVAPRAAPQTAQPQYRSNSYR